ncbi:putative Ig domain-containing protein [Streptomyces mirabilis]|uniref:putative Ig domain-containing protein n=1 Tax=Streptomyces mirabilis TaxID=68239 RepID=UPI003F4D4C58
MGDIRRYQKGITVKIRKQGNRSGRCGASAWSRSRHLTQSTRLALAGAVLVGSAVVAGQTSVATAASSCASLAACYDNVGISSDSNTALGDFDDHGNSYSEEALTAVGAAPGAAIVSSGMRFTFPDVPAGTNDNTVAQGQSIALSGATGNLGFLVSASNGSATGTGTITYTDGSTQSYTLSSPDWLSTTPPTNGAVAVSSARRNGPETSYPVNIFSQSITLNPGKSLASVTLPPGGPLTPNAPALHIFDISTVTADAGNTVTVTNPGNQTSVTGARYSLQVQASDSASGQSLTYTASGLPAGLSINSSTGLISGTPTAVGTSTVTVTATDTAGGTGSATFTWTVTRSTCKVTYRQYPLLGALFVMTQITNTGTSAINGWTLKYTFGGDQEMVFNPSHDQYGNYSQSGKEVTITNGSADAIIQPNATVTPTGFFAGYRTSPAPPTIFTLNGNRCAS